VQPQPRRRLRTALVLGGGGARGAYEAGVLSYLRGELRRELGEHVGIDIISGTSVGAINACFAAGTAAILDRQGQGLVEKWQDLRVEHVLRVGPTDFVRALRDLFRRTPLQTDRPAGGLVDPKGLLELVRDQIPWREVSRNIRSGRLQALSISATKVATGHTTVFIQRPQRDAPPWSRDPHYNALATRIGPYHALASAAIPLLFPAVPVAGELYVDGGLRQNVPISPALRLGAERVIVVSLRHHPVATALLPPGQDMQPAVPGTETAPQPGKRARRKKPPGNYPSGPFLLGKTLDALLLDRVDEDLSRLRRFNALLEAGTQAYGPDFERVLNTALEPERNTQMRYVRNLLVHPSEDMGKLAADYCRSPEFRKRASGLVGGFLRRMVESEARDKADLASYLLFDGGFADILVDLGRRDARARREQWLRFFSDEPERAAEAAQLDNG
jgi:NTE family protein